MCAPEALAVFFRTTNRTRRDSRPRLSAAPPAQSAPPTDPVGAVTNRPRHRQRHTAPPMKTPHHGRGGIYPSRRLSFRKVPVCMEKGLACARRARHAMPLRRPNPHPRRNRRTPESPRRGGVPPPVAPPIPQIEDFNADGTPGRETRPLQNAMKTSAQAETSVRQPPVTACAVPAPFKGGNSFRTTAPIRRGGYQPPAAPPIPHRTADENAAPPTDSVGAVINRPSDCQRSWLLGSPFGGAVMRQHD